MHRRQSAFTLVELLVVVAILALLAGLFLPVLATARRHAWRITCTSNLRQLAVAFSQYVQDYDDTFPANHLLQIDSLTAAHRLWIWQVRPYLRSDTLFHCPADPVRNARRTLSNGIPWHQDRPELPALSYGANWRLMVAAWEGRPEGRVAALPYPSQTLLVADCTEPWAHGPLYRDERGVRWSHIAYANGPPVDGNVNVFHGGRSGMRHERHGEGSHVAFFDGHVAYLPAARFVSETWGEGAEAVAVQRPIVSPEAIPVEAVSGSR